MTTLVPTLVRFENRPEKFDLSPWVNRLDALLTFSGAEYELEKKRGDNRAQPRGLLPVVKVGDETIPDSLFAYETLVKRGLAKELDEGLSEEDSAKSRAIQSLVEEMYWIMTKERWHDQYYYSRDKKILAFLPYPIRVVVGYMIYRKLYPKMNTFGLVTRPKGEVNQLQASGLDAIATFIGSKQYILGGEKPTRADAVVFGFLAALYASPDWSPMLYDAAQKRPNLLTYVEGIRQTWFSQRESLPRSKL